MKQWCNIVRFLVGVLVVIVMHASRLSDIDLLLKLLCSELLHEIRLLPCTTVNRVFAVTL